MIRYLLNVENPRRVDGTVPGEDFRRGDVKSGSCRSTIGFLGKSIQGEVTLNAPLSKFSDNVYQNPESQSDIQIAEIGNAKYQGVSKYLNGLSKMTKLKYW